MLIEEIYIKHSVKEIIHEQVKTISVNQAPLLFALNTEIDQEETIHNLTEVLGELNFSCLVYPVYILSKAPVTHPHYYIIQDKQSIPSLYLNKSKKPPNALSKKIKIEHEKRKQIPFKEKEQSLLDYAARHKVIVQESKWQFFLRQILKELK